MGDIGLQRCRAHGAGTHFATSPMICVTLGFASELDLSVLKKCGSSTRLMSYDCRIRFNTRYFWSGSIVLWRKSARGLAHSKTPRAVRVRSVHAPASWSAAALRRFGTSTHVISLRTRPRPPQPSFRILQCYRLPRCSGMNVQSRLYPLKMSRNRKTVASAERGFLALGEWCRSSGLG